MMKYSFLILLMAISMHYARAYPKPTHEGEIANVAVEAIHETFEKVLETAPEPFRSEALMKLEEAKNKGLDNMNDYFAEVSKAFKDFSDKSRSKRAVFKPEFNPALLAVKEEMMKEIFIWTLIMDSSPLEKPILIEKLDEALEMKFTSIDDFAKYCVKIYNDVTGKTADYHAAMNFDKLEEHV